MNTQSFKEIMRRSLYNRDYIKPKDEKNGPYAVTQLVNSFLGAFAHAYDKTLDGEFLDSSKKKRQPAFRPLPTGWPAAGIGKSTDPDLAILNDVRDVCRLMRNGIAHGHIEFEAGDPHSNEITKIHIWNVTAAGKENWRTVISVEELGNLLDLFYKFINETYEDNGTAKST